MSKAQKQPYYNPEILLTLRNHKNSSLTRMTDARTLAKTYFITYAVLPDQEIDKQTAIDLIEKQLRNEPNFKKLLLKKIGYQVKPLTMDNFM